MKSAQILLSFGLFSCSLGLLAQPPAPRQNTSAQTTSQTTSQTPAQTTLAPGEKPAEPANGAQPTPGMTAPDDTPPGVAPATQGEPVVPAGVDADYVLGNEDAIVVNVWREPSLTGGLVIRQDGKISLPLLGDLPAAGLTPMALANEISEHLKKFMNNPTVTVTVTASNSRRVFFIGEVLKPGPLPLTHQMSMLQAISAAGGLTPFANKKKIYILRGVKGKEIKIPFDYNKAVKKGDMQGVTLTSGDTVVVP
jgi:polysaccharide export outer membrane protein